MAEETEMLWVCSGRDDGQVVFYERDDEHPGGVAAIGGDAPFLVAPTPNVAKALREGSLVQLSDREVEEYHARKAEERKAALMMAPLPLTAPAPNEEVADLKAEVAELRAMLAQFRELIPVREERLPAAEPGTEPPPQELEQGAPVGGEPEETPRESRKKG